MSQQPPHRTHSHTGGGGGGSSSGSSGGGHSLHILHGYQLGSVLGRGTYGVVYRATRLRDGQPVAIKTVALTGLSEAAGNNLVREVGLLMELKHRNILQFREKFVEDRILYLVTELADQGDMSQLLKREGGRLSLTLTQYYLRQLAAALQHLHSRHIAHLDLKPSNMLLCGRANRSPVLKVRRPKNGGTRARNLHPRKGHVY